MSHALKLTQHLGSPLDDEDQEVFELFSHHDASGDLGMVDATASAIELQVAGREMSIRQSLSLLRSHRSGGTTGAVVWRVTPIFAEWVCSPSNLLFRLGLLDENSTVIELGCGVSGLVGLALAPKIRRYVLTDQDYVIKLLSSNITDNTNAANRQGSNIRKRGRSKMPARGGNAGMSSNIEMHVLDWETTCLDDLPTLIGTNISQAADATEDGESRGEGGIDAVIACDCIFNEHIVEPFVETCASLCRNPGPDAGGGRPTLCIIAQQLRSAEVFEAWLHAMKRHFDVWRLPAEEQGSGTGGIVVHLAVHKDYSTAGQPFGGVTRP